MGSISSKNKRVLSLYWVTVIDQIVINRRIEKLQLLETRCNTSHRVEVEAHFVSLNHQSGALTFWLFNNGTGTVDRIRIFPKGTWNHFEKVRDL
jgi:hypothetical protein